MPCGQHLSTRLDRLLVRLLPFLPVQVNTSPHLILYSRPLSIWRGFLVIMCFYLGEAFFFFFLVWAIELHQWCTKSLWSLHYYYYYYYGQCTHSALVYYLLWFFWVVFWALVLLSIVEAIGYSIDAYLYEWNSIFHRFDTVRSPQWWFISSGSLYIIFVWSMDVSVQ